MTDTVRTGGTEAAERLMSSLAGVLASPDDLPTYLDGLVHAVNASIDGCDAVGVTVVMEDRPRTAAYTTAQTLEIDAVQYSVGDGPCLDAFRNLRENIVDLVEADDRWPSFMQGVDQHGVQSLLAVPLLSGDRALGALNLYGYERYAFDATEVGLVRMAAARAADAIAAMVELSGAREVAAQMEQAMASRAVIEQAKGMLMAQLRIDETQAFHVLSQQSQHRNLKLREVASQVVRGMVEGGSLTPASHAGGIAEGVPA